MSIRWLPIRRPLIGAGLFLFCCALLASPALAAAAKGLKVTSLLPQGQTPRLTQIVVSFSQPMVPLGAAEQDQASAPLRLDPRPPGVFRWLDPQTLAYILEKPTAGATRVRVTVPAGAKSLDGQTLAKDVTATVFTPPVAVSEISPQPGEELGQRPSLRLTLNQPVRLDSLQQHLALLVNGQKTPAKVAEAPAPEWESDADNLGASYVLTTDADLPADAKVSLRMEPGVMPAEGDLPSADPFNFEYVSYRPLRLVKWEMANSLLGGHDPASDLTLEFNNPVKAQDLWNALTFEPALPAPQLDPETEPGRWLSLSPPFKPGQKYKVTIAAGLADQFGTKLAQPVVIELAVGDRNPIMDLGPAMGVIEPPGVAPLRVRNLRQVELNMRFFEPDQVVPAMAAEQERAWDAKPVKPKAGQPGVVRKVLDLGLQANQSVLKPLDLAALLGRSPQGGVILVDARAYWPNGEGVAEERVQRSVLQVTDLGLSLKLGAAGGAAWVTSLSGGQPLEGVDLQLRDRKNRVLWQGRSDASGLATLPAVDVLKPAPDKQRSWRDPVVYLIARRGDDLAVTPGEWGNDLVYELPYNVNYSGPAGEPPYAAHALVQLPLYQPGQVVRYVVYLRKRDPGGLVAPAPQDVRLLVKDAYGRQLAADKARTNAYGAVEGTLKLGPEARLGDYSIAVELGGNAINAGGFQVASFRPPDFKIDLTAPASHVGPGPLGQAKIDAQYLFGAPLAGGKAELRASQEQSAFAPARLADYIVGDLPLPGQEPNLNKDLGQKDAVLGSDGQAAMELPAAAPLPGMPVDVRLEVTVSSLAGMAQRTSASVVAHPADVYLGLKTPMLVTAGAPAQIDLLAATAADAPTAVGQVRLTAYRQWWETVRERGPGGYYRHLGQARRDQVWQQTVALAATGGQASFTPPQAGTYVIVAEATDSGGRIARSAAYLWASGAGEAGWERFDGHKVELTPDRDNLSPGQSVKLMIKNPFAKATALISVERRGVRRMQVRQVEGPAPVVDVPIEQGDAPGVYIGVLLVRGRVAEPVRLGVDLGKPQVRIGYATIKVSRPEGGLGVKVEVDHPQTRPGQPIVATVRANRDGRPTQAQITLLAVDERVLTAAGDSNSYDPNQTFGQLTGLAVLTADNRTQVIGKVLAAQKGEGGAGGGGLGQAMRQRFHPAVFWLAAGETDAQGLLTANFQLPDTLTAYRVVAVAIDKTDGFASAKAQIKASKPLQVLSALPRFVTAGDRFSARFLVQNLGQQPLKVVVKAAATGLDLAAPAQQEIEVAPGGGGQVVGFNATVDRAGTATLDVSVAAGPETDAARYLLPVLPRVGLTAMAAAGQLTPGGGTDKAVTPLELPVGASPGQGGLSVQMASTLAPALARPVQELIEYPFDCWEQRLSRAAARALRLDSGQALGLAQSNGDAPAIAETLALAADYQTSSGGFSYWRGQENPDLFLTAYSLLAARQMAAPGRAMDGEVAKQAAGYLDEALKAQRPKNRRDFYADTSEALAIWALAAEGRNVRAPLDAALTRTDGLCPFGLAALMQAAVIAKAPGAVDALIGRLEATAAVSATELHFGTVNPAGLKLVMGSDLRSNAAALWALTVARPAYPGLGKLARWVAARLAEQPNISTQDAVFGLWALRAYLALSQADDAKLRAEAFLGSRQLAARDFDASQRTPLAVQLARDILSPGQRQDLTISAQGTGALFWTVRLRYAPKATAAAPVNAGLRVARFFTAEGGKSAPWAMGQEVECVITVATADTRHHVLVEAPYPAGLEPVRTAGGGGDDDAWPWQWREARKTGLLLYAPQLDPGVYAYRLRLRAVAPGVFVLRPAKAEEMYAPEVFGATAEETVEVR